MIKIYTEDGLELPISKESVKISDENNAFSDGFKVYHSKRPFLILESPVTEKALGSRYISSNDRKKEYNVKVQFLNETFDGVITVLGYLKKSRKSNIRFGSELLTITDSSIKDFFGTYYLGDQIEYSETSNIILDQSFITQIENYENLEYPDVDFNFPSIFVKGITSENEDFNLSSDFLNQRNFITSEFVVNTLNNVYQNYYSVINSNSLVPMPYLMALIEKPLHSIGWALEGDFKEDDFNKKILIIPSVDNNTRLQINEGIVINYEDFPGWVEQGVPPFKLINFELGDLILGTHILKITFNNIPYTSLGNVNLKIFRYNDDGTVDNLFEDLNIVPHTNYNYETSFEFEVTDENKSETYYISYGHPGRANPDETDIRIINEAFEQKNFVQFHPTIELNRFIPDWTYLELLNNVKLLRNLTIDFDETRKRVVMNYNNSYIRNYDYVDLSGYPIEIIKDDNGSIISYLVNYANASNSELDDNTKQFTNSFKILTHGAQTINSTVEELEEDGVPICIYEQGPFVSKYFQGKSLSLEDENGSLFNLDWKTWIEFLENSSELEAVAYLPIDVIKQIQLKRKIYFNCIQFAVTKIDYEVSNKRLIEVKLYLRNINIKTAAFQEENPNLPQGIIINSVVLGSLYFSNIFNINYSIFGFTEINLTAICRKLTQPYFNGIIYDDTVIQKDNITNPSNDFVLLPLPPEYGWYEITLEQNNLISNKFYIELEEPIVGATKEIKWSLISSTNSIGNFLIEYNFLLLDNTATILGTRRDINGNQLDPLESGNTLIKNITNLSDYPSGSTMEVEFPTPGYWYVYISFSSAQSNNRPDENSPVGFEIY